MAVNSFDELSNMFKNSMEDYEKRLQKATESSPVHPDISSLSQDFSQFKSMIWQLFTKMKKEIEGLSLGLDKHETAMRRKVLLLHGVPEKQNENLHEVVQTVISDKFKTSDVTKKHLQVCHRLGRSSLDRPRPILIRFYDLEHRQIIWDSKTSLKGSGITISEFLTKTRHNIFTSARRHFGMKNCWSADGKIIIILPNKTRRKIETMQALQDTVSAFPCITVESAQAMDSKTSTKPPRSNRRQK